MGKVNFLGWPVFDCLKIGQQFSVGQESFLHAGIIHVMEQENMIVGKQ